MTTINGGTGDYTLEALAVGLALIVMFPLSCWLIDQVCLRTERAAARRRTRRLAPPPRSLSIVPDPCRFCGHRNGWHHEGCGYLDRLDTPARPGCAS